MNQRTAAILNIFNALFFAAAIVVTSRYTTAENSMTWTGLWIALWFVPFSWLSSVGCRRSEKGAECVVRREGRER